ASIESTAAHRQNQCRKTCCCTGRGKTVEPQGRICPNPVHSPDIAGRLLGAYSCHLHFGNIAGPCCRHQTLSPKRSEPPTSDPSSGRGNFYLAFCLPGRHGATQGALLMVNGDHS